MDPRYGLISNWHNYLNKIKNWNKIKQSLRWVNVNFQVQGDHGDAKYFSYNFIIKKTGDIINFTPKLIDDENKEIKFEDKGKKFPIVKFLLEFLA